jgi:hypothetical protein
MENQKDVKRSHQHANDQEDWNNVHTQLQRVQKKSMAISDPHDDEEKEADTIARKVVNGETASVSGSSNGINRKGMGEAEATPQFQSKLESSKGSGNSLPGDIQQEMGSKMGADFSGVKVHTGGEANSMSESINAKAFTSGQDIYFGSGQFDTNSKQGKELIAHELVHTQQQDKQIYRQVEITDNIPEKAKNALDEIYRLEMVSLPEQMNVNLLNWITNFNFPLDPVEKSLGEKVVASVLEKLGDAGVKQLIKLIPYPALQGALEMAYDITKEVITDGDAKATKDYSTLRKFFNSLAETYNQIGIAGETTFKDYKDATIDFQKNLAKCDSKTQQDTLDIIDKQKTATNTLYTNTVTLFNSNLYFSGLYMNSVKITPPPGEDVTVGGGFANAFISISYNVDSSPGVLGEKNGKYEYFPKPAYKDSIEAKGYRMIEDYEILSVLDELDFPTKLHIYYALERAGMRGKPFATLYAPKAANLKETLYAYPDPVKGADMLDLNKLSVRKRLMGSSYTYRKDFNENGTVINEGAWGMSGNYDHFYWNLMWQIDKFPVIQKDKMYTADA